MLAAMHWSYMPQSEYVHQILHVLFKQSDSNLFPFKSVSGRFDPKTREQNEVYYHDTRRLYAFMMTYTSGDGLFAMAELCRQDELWFCQTSLAIKMCILSAQRAQSNVKMHPRHWNFCLFFGCNPEL